MPYTESDPGSPPPLESVLPARDDRTRLDFSSISSHSALEKIRGMRKDEGVIENQIRQLEKQLQLVKSAQSNLKGESPDHPPMRRPIGISDGGPPSTSAKVVKKSKSPRDKNLFRSKLPQYEPSLACPPHRCTSIGFDKSSTSNLSTLLLEIFELSAKIATDRYLPVLLDVLRDDMLEKMTPTMFAIPYGEQLESTIRAIAGGILPAVGNEFAEYGIICPFLADLMPTVFSETLAQINGAMSRTKDADETALPHGDTCLCHLSRHLPILRDLRDRLVTTSESILELRLRNSRSLNLKHWINWIETQHTLGRFDPSEWAVFEPDGSGLSWQRRISRALSFVHSVWEEEVGKMDRTEMIVPVLQVYEYLGGIQLYEEAKRWRVESCADPKTDSHLELGGWRSLIELPYFKTSSLRLSEGTPPHLKEIGDQLSRSDPQKAAQYYDTAALLSLPLFTARTNAALMRLQHDTPRELERAVSDCTTVLYFEATNWKALSRRGRAYAGLGWYRYALSDLEAAIRMEPTNKDLKVERDRVFKIWEAERWAQYSVDSL